MIKMCGISLREICSRYWFNCKLINPSIFALPIIFHVLRTQSKEIIPSNILECRDDTKQGASVYWEWPIFDFLRPGRPHDKQGYNKESENVRLSIGSLPAPGLPHISLSLEEGGVNVHIITITQYGQGKAWGIILVLSVDDECNLLIKVWTAIMCSCVTRKTFLVNDSHKICLLTCLKQLMTNEPSLHSALWNPAPSARTSMTHPPSSRPVGKHPFRQSRSLCIARGGKHCSFVINYH